MSFSIRELHNDEDYNPSILSMETPFTQARFYGAWQKSLGRKVRRFVITEDTSVISYFQVVKYPLAFGLYYLYAPYGPVVSKYSEAFFQYLRTEFQKIAKEENAVFVRLDFTPVILNESLSSFFTKAPSYTYHSAYFQPRNEWHLPLEKSEKDLLMGMHEKTRYSVRLAEKKGISVEIVTENFSEHFESFHTLLVGTAHRNGFRLHAKEYYKTIFDTLSSDASYVVVARYGKKILAMDLIVVFGSIATYVFGGSSNEERNRMPTYSAHWRGICHAKMLGCKYYNFGGISTEGDVYKGWDGLTTFKMKFGGNEVAHSEFFDVVEKPLLYTLYNLRKRFKKIFS